MALFYFFLSIEPFGVMSKLVFLTSFMSLLKWLNDGKRLYSNTKDPGMTNRITVTISCKFSYRLNHRFHPITELERTVDNTRSYHR